MGRGLVRAGLLALVVLLVSSGLGGAGVEAASPPTPTAQDHLQLTQINAQEQIGASATSAVQLSATVNYQIATVPRGILALFVLEDNAQKASVDSSAGKWVDAGSGQIQLTTSYTPSSAGNHQLVVVAGLFNADKSLLAWTKTQPFSLNAIPGRSAFESALTAYQAGQYQSAIDRFGEAITQAPKIGLYYCWRADSLVHLDQYSAAVADYTQALSLSPQDRGCRVGRGIAYLWNGNPRSAVQDLSAVINASTTADRWTAWALRARGVALAELGDYPDAVSDYRSYLALVPNAPDHAQVSTWISQLQAMGQTG